MRIGGEGKGEEVEIEEGDEVERMESVSMSMQNQQQQVVVGYALTSKKKKSFLQPKLEVLARNKGILFTAIDLNKPLGDQGPFDIVIHKLLGKDWYEVIEDYRQKHPEVTVIDPPAAIRHLSNRQSMLQYVADLKLSDFYGTVCIPRQMVIDRDPSSIALEVSKAGLKLPLVAKPLLVDGTAKSHQLSLAYDQFSLSELEPPLVLQEFVNHGGVLFKIYIMGESIKVVRRFSLPNVSNCELEKVAGVMRFPRVSCAAASADDADLDPSVAELPPHPLLERLAKELRCQMGLSLFNIDMIREHGSKDVFYVIDINYFPGKHILESDWDN
ncbi:Inositol-tetrakisphosphate 1-kinase 2 [Linum grandiflorum]